MKGSVLGRVKRAFRANVRRCYRLFYDLPEDAKLRKRRLVKTINDLHSLDNVKVEMHTFFGYGKVCYIYDSKNGFFTQPEAEQGNNMFLATVTPDMLIRALDSNNFIISNIF